jgi:small subunit ribosomal protein S16
MPLKLRLQRHGKKGKPFYWLVAADSRAKRDGRYLEKLGTYNPNTNPATVNIDIDRAVNWMEKGAQPTDTARNLLSYKGAMLKYHLNGGVRKGALTQEVADQKLAEWLKEKEANIQAKKEGLTKSEAEAAAKRLAAEKEASEKRLAAAAAEEAEAVAEQEPAPEEAPAETEAAPEEVKKKLQLKKLPLKMRLPLQK